MKECVLQRTRRPGGIFPGVQLLLSDGGCGSVTDNVWFVVPVNGGGPVDPHRRTQRGRWDPLLWMSSEPKPVWHMTVPVFCRVRKGSKGIVPVLLCPEDCREGAQILLTRFKGFQNGQERTRFCF